MNVGNIRIHKWVITTHPEIVSRYSQYNKENPFDIIELNYEVEDYKEMKDTYGKLIALFVYNTNDFHKNSTKRVQNEFGLGKEVAFNAIIGIPTLKQWKDSTRFEVNFLNSTLHHTQFPLIYKPANTGLTSSFAFDYK